jgi:hypothetical protein
MSIMVQKAREVKKAQKEEDPILFFPKASLF